RQHVDDVVRVGDAIEILAEVGAVDEFSRNAVALGDFECAARTVGHDDDDRKSAFQHRVQDRAGSRGEDSDPHAVTLSPDLPRSGSATSLNSVSCSAGPTRGKWSRS